MEDKEAQPAPEVEVITGDTLENPPEGPAQTEYAHLQEMIRHMGEQLSKNIGETIKEELKDTNKKIDSLKEDNRKLNKK